MNKLKIWRMCVLLFATVMAFSFTSCGDDDEPKNGDPNDYASQLIGSWYNNYSNYGFHFNADGSGYDYTYGGRMYIDEALSWWIENGNTLVIQYEESGTEKHTIYELTATTLVLDGATFSREGASNNGNSNNDNNNNSNSDNNNNGSGNTSDNNGNNNGNNIPYESYVKYSYSGKTYIHQLSYATSLVEMAPAGTIHGNNWKYLNFYIDNRHCAFFLESAYFLDEIPPSGKWPAGKYVINYSEASMITNMPIARVNIYDDNLNKKSSSGIQGVATISYSGDIMVFDFIDSINNDDYKVEIHFKGKCNY